MKKVYVATEGTIPVEQLKEFVEDVIKVKKENGSKPSFTYSEPYTIRIHNLVIHAGYQSPKFQQFDGKGNPK